MLIFVMGFFLLEDGFEFGEVGFGLVGVVFEFEAVFSAISSERTLSFCPVHSALM